MTVEHFVSVYPYPLGIVTSGVECTISTFANNANWKQHILSGAMAKQADEFLYVHHLGHRHASEHPPSAFEAIIGAPSFETHTFVHGDPNGSKPVFAKTIHWYARGLPAVHPTCAVPDQLQRDRPSHSDADVQMVLRSSMTRHFATAHNPIGGQHGCPPTATRPTVHRWCATWQHLPLSTPHRAPSQTGQAVYECSSLCQSDMGPTPFLVMERFAPSSAMTAQASAHRSSKARRCYRRWRSSRSSCHVTSNRNTCT
jgi:hypothetical protein